MKKYIPLDALVAEIEKLKGKVNDSSSYCNGWQHALRMLELSLDTLEVKEVDFEDTKSVFEGQYLSKDKVVTTIERLQDECEEQGDNNGTELLEKLFNKLDTLEVVDPYEQCIQYTSIESGIKTHAEVYSFNIESELFNQLTKEQQALWRKEIEQAYISGGYSGLDLAKDPRYKENHEVKEVDLKKEIKRYRMNNPIIGHREESLYDYITNVAKHFFELGMRVSNPITASDRGVVKEIIFALNALGKEKMISYDKEIKWLKNKVQIEE